MDGHSDERVRPTVAGLRDEPADRRMTAEVQPFDDFYRTQLPGLVALARSLCPPAVAEDVAQEAMLVALRRWSHVSRLGRPEAWVRRTCANLAVSQFRRSLVELRVTLRLRPSAAVLPTEPDDELWRLVRRLPRRQAQAVALHYLFDLGVAEIAETLECSPGSVKVHLSRGREALRRELAREEVGP
jgi:RNA polymerase sigma-70 factor (ECF subfamily)